MIARIKIRSNWQQAAVDFVNKHRTPLKWFEPLKGATLQEVITNYLRRILEVTRSGRGEAAERWQWRVESERLAVSRLSLRQRRFYTRYRRRLHKIETKLFNGN